MAKKGGKRGKRTKGTKRARESFLKEMTQGPTREEYGRFERAQREQFTPAIRELARQAGMTPAMDPRVRELERQMGAERSVEDIGAAYGGGLEKLQTALAGTDFAGMGRGVTGAISGLGEALGVEGAGEIGEAAGRVSGIGEGQDIFSKAILGGATSRFKELESTDIRDRANRLSQLGMSKAEALKEARREKRDIRLQLAQMRGQRAGAVVDPLQRAMGFLQLGEALRGYGGGYGGGYASGGTSGGPPPSPTGRPSPFLNMLDVEGTSGGMSSYYPGSSVAPAVVGEYAGTSRPAPRRRR